MSEHPTGFDAQPTDGFAIASLVVGIVSLVLPFVGILTGFVGVVFGAIGIGRCTPPSRRDGKGLAVAGLILSIAAIVIWLVIIQMMQAMFDGFE